MREIQIFSQTIQCLQIRIGMCMQSMMPRNLLILVAVLFVFLNGYYYHNHTAHQKYIENRDVVWGVNGKALVSGTVLGYAPNGFCLQINHVSSKRTIVVLSDAAVRVGDWIAVFGCIEQGQIMPDNMVVKDRMSHCAIFIVSAMTIPFVGYLFLRSWAFDVKVMRIRKKDA